MEGKGTHARPALRAQRCRRLGPAFLRTRRLIVSRRTSGNQRRYQRDTLRRVAFIRISQRVGIPLSEIREALGTLPEGRTPNRADWERLSTGWRRHLDLRIEQLERLRDNLTGCIGCGCLSLEGCALANPHDQLASAGRVRAFWK